MGRIDSQSPEDRSLARRTIYWISHAKRPLRTDELSCALAIKPGDNKLNLDNLYDAEDIASVCAGLVTIDEESRIVRLVHYTTQVYFESMDWNDELRVEPALTCLTYLSFDISPVSACDLTSDENRFLDYATSFCGAHVRPVETAPAVVELTLMFLRHRAARISVLGMKRHGYGNWQYLGTSERGTGTCLHLMAEHGLAALTGQFLRDETLKPYTDRKDDYSQTPLFVAAGFGHGEIVKQLLDTGKVDTSSRDHANRTPLWVAVANGHDTVVKQLIETDTCDLNVKDIHGVTPLHVAAWCGHEAVVQLLIDTGRVDLEVKDHDGLTPLSCASERGEVAVVRQLLDSGKVHPSSRGRWCRMLPYPA